VLRPPAPSVRALPPVDCAEPLEDCAQPPEDGAQPPEDGAPGDGGPDGGAPAAEGPAVVVDEREAELQEEQRRLEREAAREAVEAEEPEPGLSHRNQVGLRVGAGVPFVFALRYTNDDSCRTVPDDEDPGTFCNGVGSAVLDLEASFGLNDGVELTAMGRLGLAGEQPTTSNLLAFGIGIRGYSDPRSAFKVFFGGRVWLDVTNAGMAREWPAVDAGVRGEFGLQLDIARFLGVYAQGGLNVLFVRALSFIVDVTGGLQVRFP
ncbi:MAG: hypothetical protein ACFCGT_22105, partial [Sandaracinaceae bacterium]